MRPACLSARFRRSERASALVEFAIIAPLLFMLVFGIMDVGRFFFDYNNLVNAAREGARSFAVAELTSANRTACESRVRNRLADPTRAAAATVTCNWQGTVPNRTVFATIQNYPFTTVMPFYSWRNRLPNIRAEFRHEFQ